MAGTALPRQGRNLACMATRQMAARKEAGTYAGGYLMQVTCIIRRCFSCSCYMCFVHTLLKGIMPVHTYQYTF